MRSRVAALPHVELDDDTSKRRAPERVEIRDNLHARIAEARQQGWLGEVDGLQISLTGARQKLAQLDQIAAKPTSTHLGMPSFPQIAGRSVPPPDTPA